MKKAIKVWFIETGHPSSRVTKIEITPASVRNGYKYFGLIDEPEIEGSAEVALFEEHMALDMFTESMIAEYQIQAAAAIRDWASRETKSMETAAFHLWAKDSKPEHYAVACEPGHRKERKALREDFQNATGVMVSWY